MAQAADLADNAVFICEDLPVIFPDKSSILSAGAQNLKKIFGS
jgi:hypothetical protein